MVVSHATEEGGATGPSKPAAGKTLVANLKSMLSKPKAQAA
jgi:hypothetical protein